MTTNPVCNLPEVSELIADRTADALYDQGVGMELASNIRDRTVEVLEWACELVCPDCGKTVRQSCDSGGWCSAGNYCGDRRKTTRASYLVSKVGGWP